MTFIVLSDDQVKDVLENLTVDELDEFRHVLSSALHEFSTNPKNTPVEPYQQPPRITTLHPTSKATTLYMPCAGPEGMGCKGKQKLSSCQEIKFVAIDKEKNVQLYHSPHLKLPRTPLSRLSPPRVLSISSHLTAPLWVSSRPVLSQPFAQL